MTDIVVPDFGALDDDEKFTPLSEARRRAGAILRDDSNAFANMLRRLIACVDLTTLAGDDTRERVRTLTKKASCPVEEDDELTCAAVCVYPLRVFDVAGCLAELGERRVKLASVAGGFPSGQYRLESRLLEVELAVADGADEIDVVINRGAALAGDWTTVEKELLAMRRSCGTALLKVILSVGELRTYENIYRASWIAMRAGADFIKTSTGKEFVNATLPYAYVMLRAIRDFERNSAASSQRRVGFKAAGGIRSVVQALEFAALPAIVFDDDASAQWSSAARFRIGASALLDELINALRKCQAGGKN